jgi:protein fantom
MNYYEMEDSMVPERDQQSGYDAGNELMDDPQAAMILKTSMAAFNQQRSVVAKLSREEIEDRYLRLLEENVVLKKHAVKQEEKIKKIATKLIRVMSDKKRLELGGPPSTRGGGHRDIETEELIEDQQQRIRELERTTNQFKDRLTVAKQQMLAVQQQTQNAASSMRPRRPKTLPQSPSQAPSLLMMSPTPTTGHHHQQLLSQQAQHLLEEARNENRMLTEQVNMFELEVEQIQEQAKIKEANYEEEIGLLRDQVKERNYQDVAENIELIRLQQDKKNRSTQLTTVKAQISAFEEQVSNLKAEVEKLKCENADLSTNLADEQRKAISLASELASNSASKQALMEAEEKLRDVQKENAIIRESNAKLLDSAYNVERERQFVASENALKVQVAQLETTLKADLNDKKMLSDALCNEREALAKVDSDYQDLQSNYFSLKETMEGHEEKLKFFAQENSVQACDLEEALLWLRQRSAGSGQQQQKTNGVVGGGHYPEFLEAGEATNGNVMDTDAAKQLRSDLSQVQAHHVEAVNELEKTRSLLRVQANINIEQKNEIEALQQRLFHVKAEFQGQIGEYKKLLDMRASRYSKLLFYQIKMTDNVCTVFY